MKDRRTPRRRPVRPTSSGRFGLQIRHPPLPSAPCGTRWRRVGWLWLGVPVRGLHRSRLLHHSPGVVVEGSAGERRKLLCRCYPSVAAPTLSFVLASRVSVAAWLCSVRSFAGWTARGTGWERSVSLFLAPERLARVSANQITPRVCRQLGGGLMVLGSAFREIGSVARAWG
jgi:hypothetical protein